MQRRIAVAHIEARIVVRACFVWASVFLALPGCQLERENEQREFSRISQAVDRLRAADNRSKAAHLARLEAGGCEKFCELRALCVQAYRQHLEGLAATERARVASTTDALPETVGELMAGAQGTLKEAREKTVACAALQGELSRAPMK